MGLKQPFDAALRGFNEEAILYCQSISDVGEREYAMDYARILRNRAKGLENEQSRFSARMLVSNRNLIKAALDKMYLKHFAA